MTYRRDSNVFNGYGRIFPLSAKAKAAGLKGQWLSYQASNTDNFTDKRTKEIAWMVSHCHTDSKRELIVNKWRSITNLTIDVYGKCKGMKLPPSTSETVGRSITVLEFRKKSSLISEKTLTERTNLYLKNLKKYKFYLSFENSLCQDYITEKFFMALQAGAVPIVYGGKSKEDYSKVRKSHFRLSLHGAPGKSHISTAKCRLLYCYHF